MFLYAVRSCVCGVCQREKERETNGKRERKKEREKERALFREIEEWTLFREIEKVNFILRYRYG